MQNKKVLEYLHRREHPKSLDFRVAFFLSRFVRFLKKILVFFGKNIFGILKLAL